MSQYYERFFAENPTTGLSETEILEAFYAVQSVCKYDKNGREIGRFWHVLLTEAQLAQIEQGKLIAQPEAPRKPDRDARLTKLKRNLPELKKQAVRCSNRPAEMKPVGAGSGLLHSFGPGRSAPLPEDPQAAAAAQAALDVPEIG